MTKIIAITVMLLALTIVSASAQVRLYSNDGAYLGNFNSNQYDPDSVSNPYGRYGNPYSPDSINNPYGRYGNPYSPESVTNPYATGGVSNGAATCGVVSCRR